MPNESVIKDGGPTNLYLPRELKEAAKKIAAERYGKPMSLSQLVQRLLVAEIKRKRGIAHLNDRELVTTTRGGK